MCLKIFYTCVHACEIGCRGAQAPADLEVGGGQNLPYFCVGISIALDPEYFGSA